MTTVRTFMELDGNRLAISPEEMQVLGELGNLVGRDERAAQNRVLATAHRVVNSRDGRYALAIYQLEIGNRRGDDALRAEALDYLIASGQSPPKKLPGHLAARGEIAFRAGDFEKAEALWGRLAELTPTDPNALANLAQAKLGRSDAQGAYDLLTRAIAMREAVTRPASESWYQQRLSIAQQGRLVTAGIAAARALVSTYPSPANWRAAMIVYRDLAAPSGPAEVDLLRFMRHAELLRKPDEYQRMAQLLDLDEEVAEAKAVLDEGQARGLLDPRVSPTREIIAEVDRSAALLRRRPATSKEKLSEAGTQVREAIARVETNRPEAEAQLHAVADNPAAGPYRDLAAFWLTFLDKAAAAAR